MEFGDGDKIFPVQAHRERKVGEGDEKVEVLLLHHEMKNIEGGGMIPVHHGMRTGGEEVPVRSHSGAKVGGGDEIVLVQVHAEGNVE